MIYKIAVCDDQVIDQRGNHETLIAKKEEQYAELWNAQSQYYQ